jgi:glycosyltransferase involved in cell wall biosynthesis
LKVLLDATAVPPDRRGVGRYVDSLIPALAAAGARPRVVCRAGDEAHYAVLSGGTDPIPTSFATTRPARLVWEQAGLSRIARRERPDVLHSPHYTHPLTARRLSGSPLVVTLHDATFFSDPQLHTRSKGPFFRAATRLALHRADMCVVPSQATADELVRFAGADPSLLRVAHLGVDTEVFSPAGAAARDRVRRTLGLGDGDSYIAFLGTIEPRKNIPALIAGWSQAFAGRPGAPALVVAGGSGWDVEFDAAAAGIGDGLRLIRPGYLPLADLAGLLSGAVVVAYPSLGEGFGLPVLEAMACGAPVLTTRRLALPEVGGDAVAYTETDAGAIGRALRALIDDPERRAGLAAAGLARAARFSWQACAQAHLAAYEQAARLRPARTGGRR